MNQQLLALISEWTTLLFLAFAFIILLMANIYDIKQALRRKSIRKMQSKFRRIRKPTISILVFTMDNAPSIENCLESIRRNRYPHYDVVIVDNSSNDNTRQLVRSYKHKHPKLPLRLYSKKRRDNKLEALNQGYIRSQKGDLVLVIDATSTISTSFLRNCAAGFIYDDNINAIHFNVHNINSNSITLLYYLFRQLSGSLMNKLYSLVSKYRLKINDGGNMYRRTYFNRAHGASVVSGNYDSYLLVSDCSVNDDKTALVYRPNNQTGSLYYLIFAIAMILLQTYSIYIAATLQSRLLLIVGWLATALWLLLATWSAEALRTNDKVRLSLCAPIIYFLIYTQLIIYVILITIATIIPLSKQIVRGFASGAMARY